MIDVDGSHLYKKHQQLAVSGVTVAPLTHPSPPLSGWKSVTETSVKTLAKEVPRVTSGNLFCILYKAYITFYDKDVTSFSIHALTGLVYTYLAGTVGHSKTQGAFRVLSCGYTHWASGRLSVIDIHTQHPAFCHVRSTMKPSMKPGVYQVYILLSRGEGPTWCLPVVTVLLGEFMIIMIKLYILYIYLFYIIVFPMQIVLQLYSCVCTIACTCCNDTNRIPTPTRPFYIKY